MTNDDAKELRKQLINECNLSMILDLPKGTFQGAGVETVVLFFEKGKPTKKIWYYKLNPGRNLGKTNPLNESDLEDFVKLAKTQKLSDNSWHISVDKINKETLDLGVQNPNIKEEKDNRSPKEIIKKIEEINLQSQNILKTIKEIL